MIATPPPSHDGTINGALDPRFAPVFDAFRENFNHRGELGAACAVYFHGKKVVDLWGGLRDHRTAEPWEHDTLACVFSTTKGLTATALALAHSRGYFELDAPVADYWPEFAAEGKQRISVRQLFAHQAGLPAVDESLTPQHLADLDAMASILARQKPAWNPGTRHGYHGLNLGFYQNEFLRRVDPQRRTVRQFFRHEIAGPLNAEFHIGLPDHVEASRLAHLKCFHPTDLLRQPTSMPFRMLASLAIPRSLTRRTLLNPRMRTPTDIAGPDFRSLHFPSAAGFGTARGIARIYGDLALGGPQLRLSANTFGQLTAPPTPPTYSDHDAILRIRSAYALGYWKPCPAFPVGTDHQAFGTHGAGGSIGFADPALGLGFSYIPNRMGTRLYDDPRELALRNAALAAARACLATTASRPSPSRVPC